MRRLLFILAAPLIPVVRLRRSYREICRIGERDRLLPRALPPLCLALTVHALGEVTGYAFGPGNGEQQYSKYEMTRIEHITDEDRHVELAG
jgi:hypothetical protein